jgi:nucleoside-triphosphatase THEP1
MQIISSKPLSQKWLKAAVIGSIWASVEIILGSFLHNLKIPMSGMILSFISVYLLISFLQVWKENGLIIRAGIICAFLKSISPSALIIGPMIGILTEAMLIEFYIFIFGKNLVGYLIGGAFAVLATLLQKVASLLILYGFDFIKILKDLYSFAVKQINLEQLGPAILIIIITVVYIITGMAGAISGYITGSGYLKNKKKFGYENEVTLYSKSQFSDQAVSQSYSLTFLLLNFSLMVAILFLMNSSYIIAAIVFSVIYLVFCILKYKNSLRRLKKISFWVSFMVITFAAAFLWNGFKHGAFFSVEGLIIGLKMNVRAIIIVIGFASISVELRNPVIKSVLYHRGFANLYQSLNLAFSALPFFLSNLSKPGNKKKGISRISFLNILSQAETLLTIFEKEHLLKPQVVIITGEIQQGKTTFTQKIVKNLNEQKIRIAGFFSVGINDNETRTGFNLVDIGTSRQIELCSDTRDDKRLKLSRFYFNQEALALGNEILNVNNLIDKQLIVVDEIGPLELHDKGWSRAIEHLTRSSTIPQLWVVRKSLVQKISRRWNIGNAYVFDIADSSSNEVEDKLMEIITSSTPLQLPLQL